MFRPNCLILLFMTRNMTLLCSFSCYNMDIDSFDFSIFRSSFEQTVFVKMVQFSLDFLYWISKEFKSFNNVRICHFEIIEILKLIQIC